MFFGMMCSKMTFYLIAGKVTQLSQVSLTLYLLGVKKELSGVNSATLHGVKRTFDCLRMRFKRKSIVMSEAVTPFYFTKLTPVYYLRNFSYFRKIKVNILLCL